MTNMSTLVMKLKIISLFRFMNWTARSGLIRLYGRDFYCRFVNLSKQHLNEILPTVPDIGQSIFSLNYNYGPCYFAWYQALRDLGVDKEKSLLLIWQINEDLLKAFPKPALHWFAKNKYLGAFRRKATEAERHGRAGTLHSYDWRIEYHDIDKNTFAIDIYECGMMKLAKKYGYLEMFPQVCRMDYLVSHYLDNSFKRTGTLADGDECCNCWYQFPGRCEWLPEKGFVDRK